MVVEIRKLAKRMLADYDARTPGQRVGEPLDLTIAQAYTLQSEIARLREERGEKVIGYKVGCTSKAIQAQLGVTEPIFGRLFDTERHSSGVHLSASRYASLAVEGEIAVRLSKDLPGEPFSAEECREAIAEAFPVIELHNYVLPKAWPAGQWLIASNGLHAGFVRAEGRAIALGQFRAAPTLARYSGRGQGEGLFPLETGRKCPSPQPSPGIPGEGEKARCDGPGVQGETHCFGLANFEHKLNIRINEVVVGSVEDAGSLTNPIESLHWLAGRLATFGLRLRKDQIILTGSPMNLYPVGPGSRIVVEAPPMGASCVEIDP